MRYALILAGGAGLRLWPMSQRSRPKQLIPFIGGRTLLEVATDRLKGLVAPDRQYVCAGLAHREAIMKVLPDWPGRQFLGEPTGRDTLNAIGFSIAVIAKRDPEAVIGVFTADHVIEPAGEFQKIVDAGYAVVERNPATLLTFGITPDVPSTGYGYLELAGELEGGARRVKCFQEKPCAEVAERYLEAGPQRYLWNSGMFVWKASTLLDCIRRYEPETHAALMEIAGAWDSPREREVLEATYPQLKKISVDYAVMEPASHDEQVSVAAIPMTLRWLDVGSWPSYAKVCPHDEHGNAVAATSAIVRDSRNNLVASTDPGHLVALMGCDDLVIIHTSKVTLICPASQAEAIKQLRQSVEEQFGEEYV